MRLAVDAMGGDNAPKEIVLGAMKAIEKYNDIHIVLIGDKSKITEHLTNEERIEILHTEEMILSTDEPVRAVRRKKTASMVLAAQLVADKKADACISAGNTGALMAAGLFVVGRIEGIERPALAPTLPTIGGEGFLLLDVGANADAKPEHLVQYAIMGSIYSEKARGITSPRVGLLNIGTEEKKGNELVRHIFYRDSAGSVGSKFACFITIAVINGGCLAQSILQGLDIRPASDKGEPKNRQQYENQ